MFGHIPQLPQILRHLGMEVALMTRGMGTQLENEPIQTEFVWEALDGSTVRTLYQKRGYGNLAGLGLRREKREVGRHYGTSGEIALEQIETEASELAAVAPTPPGVTLLNNGSDHLGIQPEVPELLDYVNAHSATVRAVHGAYPDYLEAVPFMPERLAVVKGELRGARSHYLLPGVFSARPYLRIMNASCENLLVSRAEPLSVLAWLERGLDMDGFLDYAWKLLLQNHPHDSICGCSTDEVHREMEVRFEKVMQVGRAVAGEAATALGALTEARTGTALAVFNPSGWAIPWPVVAQVHSGLELAQAAYETSSGDRVVVDAQESQVTECHFRPETDGPELFDEISFVFKPARGCAVEIFQPAAERPDDVAGLSVAANAIANEFLRVAADNAGTPGLWVTDRTTGQEFGPFNVFHSFADAGDEYEFQPLPDNPDSQGADPRSTVMDVMTLNGSAAMKVRTVLDVPAGLSEDRRKRTVETVKLVLDTTVRLFAGHPVVHLNTTVVNSAKYHKVAALFHLPAPPKRVLCGTQFGEIERECTTENEVCGRGETLPPWHPFREYLVVPDSRLALFARGLLEFGTPQLGSSAPLALTLWRSVEHLSRDDIPFRPEHAGPYFVTPEAQCLRPMSFDYGFALTDEHGTLPDGIRHWQAARLFSNPPTAWPCESGAAGLVLVHVRNPEIVLSSIRRLPGEQTVRVTLYNATNRPVAAEIEAGFEFSSVDRTDFLGNEYRADSVSVGGNAVRAEFGPFEMICLSFVIR